MAGQTTAPVVDSQQIPQPNQQNVERGYQKPSFPRPQNGNDYSHPCKGYFNYVVGQLCCNENFFWHDDKDSPLTEEAIYIEIDKIMKIAQVICDKTMAHNRNRLEQNKAGGGVSVQR